MTNSVTNMIRSGIASLKDATFRTPHAISVNESEMLYSRKSPPDVYNMMSNEPARPASASRDGRSSEQLEHETLARIRDALYADRQA